MNDTIKDFTLFHLTPSRIFLWSIATMLVLSASLLFGAKGFALSLIAVIGGAIAWGIMRAPWAGVVTIAFVLPFERFGSVELGGFTFRASQLFLLITILALVIHVFSGRIRLRVPRLLLTLLLFFVGAVCALPQSVYLFRGVTTLVFTLFTLALVVVIPTLITNKQKLLVVVKSLLLGAIVTSAFGMFQFAGDLAGLPQELTGLRDLYTKDVFGFPRIQSTALEPLYFANYLLLPLALAIVVLLKKIRPLLPFALVLLPLSLPVFVLTLSRAAFIAGLVLLGILGFVFLRNVLRPTTLILISVLIVLTFFGVTYALSLTGDEQVSVETFSQHVTNLFEGASFADRASTNLQAIDLIAEHPFGIGPGNFGPAIATHPRVEPEGGWLIVNNIYLEVLVETGIIGFIGYIGFILAAIGSGIRTFLSPRQDEMIRFFILAVTAALISIMIQYLTFSIVYIMHIWFAFGLLLALLSVSRLQYAHES